MNYTLNMVYKSNDKMVQANVGNFTNKQKAVARAKELCSHYGGISKKIGDTDYMAYDGTSFHINKVD